MPKTMNRLKPGSHCDISISTSMNKNITNVHTCCISTRKVTYSSVMSSIMKPWEYGTRHVFKISPAAFAALQMPDTFLPTIFLSRLHLFLRLENNLHLPVLRQKFFSFVTSKSSEPGFVVEAGIIANALGKFLVENSILRGGDDCSYVTAD